jgi:hypothetical protein
VLYGRDPVGRRSLLVHGPHDAGDAASDGTTPALQWAVASVLPFQSVEGVSGAWRACCSGELQPWCVYGVVSCRVVSCRVVPCRVAHM